MTHASSRIIKMMIASTPNGKRGAKNHLQNVKDQAPLQGLKPKTYLKERGGGHLLHSHHCNDS